MYDPNLTKVTPVLRLSDDDQAILSRLTVSMQSLRDADELEAMHAWLETLSEYELYVARALDAADCDHNWGGDGSTRITTGTMRGQ